jgi:hypothetical protein
MTWDLTSYFPEFNGAEMLQFKEALRRDVETLKQSAAALAPLQDADTDAWEGILLRHEDLLRRMSHLGSYVGCLALSGRAPEAIQRRGGLARRAEIAVNRVARAVKETTGNVFTVHRENVLSGAQIPNRLREARGDEPGQSPGDRPRCRWNGVGATL